MTKEVMLTIIGLQNEIDREHPIEQIVKGDYYYRDGKHFILYEEYLDKDGDNILTKCRMKISKDSIEITKNGAIKIHMVFEKEKKTITSYLSPFGQIMAAFYTYDFTLEEKEDEMKINLSYELEMNGEHISDCLIKIKATSVG